VFINENASTDTLLVCNISHGKLIVVKSKIKCFHDGFLNVDTSGRLPVGVSGSG